METGIMSTARLERVQALDPLCADSAIRAVPDMNRHADIAHLSVTLESLTARAGALPNPSIDDCLACMRDLGILMGSLKRHAIEPTLVCPDLGRVLVELGRQTRMVARDTVFHYTAFNPPGQRRRSYTDNPQESAVIDAVRVSLPGLCHAISLATRIGQLSLTDDEFPATVYEMTHALQGMIESIQLVRDRVSPEWFAITLRPYFDTVAVNGIDLLGPAAANLPLGLIDILIWASDYADQDYTEFCGEISRYSPPEWRGLYPIWSRQPSLVKRVTTAITEGHGSARDLQRAADAVSAALRVLLIWRGRHFTVARRAYSDNARWHPVGSAGGSIGLLSSILNLTRQNATRVASSAPQHHETTGRPQRGKKRQ